MRHPIIYMLAVLLGSCQAFPQIADDIEKMETEDCITVKVTKDAIGRETNVNVGVDITNKDTGPSNAKIPQKP